MILPTKAAKIALLGRLKCGKSRTIGCSLMPYCHHTLTGGRYRLEYYVVYNAFATRDEKARLSVRSPYNTLNWFWYKVG